VFSFQPFDIFSHYLYSLLPDRLFIILLRVMNSVSYSCGQLSINFGLTSGGSDLIQRANKYHYDSGVIVHFRENRSMTEVARS